MTPSRFSNKEESNEIPSPADRDSTPVVRCCCYVWDGQAADYRWPFFHVSELADPVEHADDPPCPARNGEVGD